MIHLGNPPLYNGTPPYDWIPNFHRAGKSPWGHWRPLLRLMISTKNESARWKPEGEAHKACALAALAASEHDDILVGGLEHFLFFHILGIMIPID